MKTFELQEVDFARISRLIYEKCGINLHEGKKMLVKTRLSKRLRERNFSSFAQYYDYVTTDEGTEELVHMLDSISTNLTYFFREDSHFRKLADILPQLPGVASRKGPPRLRIWCAGCSTGEEPYSLAMTVLGAMNQANWDVKILATDICTSVLAKATAGIYDASKLENVSPEIIRKFFQRGQGRWTGFLRVKSELRGMVHFRRFNLMDPLPRDVLFDVIFCRNVMIYFDKQTQASLIGRFYDSLAEGGYFFAGHSESLTGLNHHLKYIEPSVYRK